MRRRIRKIFTWIGGITVFLVVGIFLIAILKGDEPVPEQTYLFIDFEQQVVENIPEDPISKLTSSDVLTVRDVVDAIERGANDERVVGVLTRVGGRLMGLAALQEIRDAIVAFQSTGKSAIAYSESFGEDGSGNGAYYLATAFERIYLQPSGDVGLIGLVFEHPFLKGAFEKLGVEPKMDHRHEYKNTMNLYTESSYTAAHREASESLMKSQFGQIVKGIASGRKMTEAEVRALVDRGPFPAKEAKSVGLVDSLAYRDTVLEEVEKEWGSDVEMLSLSTYLERAGRPNSEGTGVALIYGVGAVTRGKNQYDPTSGEMSMGSDSVSRAFRDAVKDKEIEAILFRVDCPGGSYIASDTIWRETVKAREAGKPVIVSMGNVAGSGGYFVAMNADKIIAQPGTITGSIGVLAGKMVTTKFWEKLGITWDEVHVGENSTIWNTGTDFTPEQWDRFQAMLDRVYSDFTEKVSAGREMPLERVLEVAKGRVWTGEDALALGLVDALGGFPVALQEVRKSLSLASDESLSIRLFPKEKSLFELIMEKGFIRSEIGLRTGPLAEKLDSLIQIARMLGFGPSGGVQQQFPGSLRPAMKVAKSIGIGRPQGVLSMSQPTFNW